MYGATSLASHFPRNQTPRVRAGLKGPPEICPPAKIITMSAEPIASGASGPAPWPMTVHPMVRTRKKVPINSATYLFMTYLLRLSMLLERRDGFGYTLSVCRVSLRAVADMTILHLLRGFSDRTSGVLEQALLLIRLQHAEEIAGLRVVVMVILAEVELPGITIDGQWRCREVQLPRG